MSLDVYRNWLNVYTSNKRKCWTMPESYEKMLDAILMSRTNCPSLWCWVEYDGQGYREWKWVHLN